MELGELALFCDLDAVAVRPLGRALRNGHRSLRRVGQRERHGDGEGLQPEAPVMSLSLHSLLKHRGLSLRHVACPIG